MVVLGHDPLRLRVEGGLFYANSVAVKDHVLTLADGGPVELDLQASDDLDVQSLDTLAELDRALDLRLTNATRAPPNCSRAPGSITRRVRGRLTRRQRRLLAMEAPKPTKKPVVAAPEPSSPPSNRPGLGMSKRERARMIGLGVLGALLVAFAASNLHSVEVNWLLGTWSTPLIVVIVVAVLFGMAIDRILVRRSRSAAKRR